MAGEMAVFGLKYRYARIAGAIETINAENLKVEEEIAFLRARLDQNTAALASLHIDLKTVEAASALAFQVDLRGTAPRKTWPKNHQGSWGSLTRQVLTQLRVAEGCPMTINDVALEVAVAMGVAGNEQEMDKLRTSVRYCLKRLALVGTVRRVRAPFEPTRHPKWAIADFVG